MKRLSLALTVLAATLASATTMLALDVTGLTYASDAVVRGTIVSVEPHWSGDNARIFTDAEVQVTEVWKGPSTLKTLTAMQPGGELGDVGQRVHGVATFAPGEEVVLFLEKRGPRFTITGMAQGKFRIEGGVASAAPNSELALLDPATHQPVSRPPLSMPLETLKAQVKAAVLQAPVEPKNPKVPGTRVTP